MQHKALVKKPSLNQAKWKTYKSVRLELYHKTAKFKKRQIMKIELKTYCVAKQNFFSVCTRDWGCKQLRKKPFCTSPSS